MEIAGLVKCESLTSAGLAPADAYDGSMHRLAWLGLCLRLLAHAQTIPLASSGDGSNFQFASNLWLKGEPLVSTIAAPPPILTRIYRYATPPVIEKNVPFNRYFLAPFISSDGLTTGSFSYFPCFRCMGGFPRNVVTLDRAGKTDEFTGEAFRISRNGRFVFDTGFFTTAPTLRNLDTGRKYEFERVLVRHPTQSLSDGGALLSTEPGSFAGLGDPTTYTKILLTPLGQAPEVLFEGGKILSAAITPKGNFVFVLQESPAAHFRLLEIDLITRTSETLWEGDTKPLGISANADGRRLVMETAQQLLLWDRTSGWRSLFWHDAGVASTLLTDNGEIVFATTRINSVYRIDANTGEAQQLYAPFPLRSQQQSGGAYPGSLIRLSTDYADPKLSFRVRDQSFPVVKAEGSIFDVQIPWEFTDSKGRTETFEVTSEDSPFALRNSVSFANDFTGPWAFTYLPESAPGPHLVAAQADFGALITPQNPASAGSIIHFWVTGLGPLNRPVATGEKGPSDPPAVPLARLACYISGRANNPPPRGLHVPTVIYAPNLIGVYQIDVEIPADWPTGTSNVFCAGQQLGGGGGFVPIGPPR